MMIRSRRTVYVAVAAGVICAIAVGLWLLLAQEEPAVVRVSAAHALQQACDTMAENDYDKTSVGTTDVDQFTATSSISGNDGHVTLSIYETGGTTLILQVETILENGVLYIRESMAPNHDTFGDWKIWKTGSFSDLTLPCFGADTSEAGGSATMERSSSSSERRIVWKTEETRHGITTQHVLWVDSTGRPVRGQIIEVPSAAGASGASSTSDDSSSGGKVVLEETYSGFGEPNVITAPIATPIPTPTPTPRPFISLPNTMLEALFAPISSGDAVGYFGTGDALKPATFRTGDLSTTVQSLKWQDSAVTLELSPYNALASQTLDFITGDGTTALSLEASAATGDSTAGTLTWAVGSQPWSSGDELMLRITEPWYGVRVALSPREEGRQTHTDVTVSWSDPQTCSNQYFVGLYAGGEAPVRIWGYHPATTTSVSRNTSITWDNWPIHSWTARVICEAGWRTVGDVRLASGLQ